MSKNQKLLIAAVLLIVFAAAKLLLLDWWQRQQSKANVVECSLTRGCVLPDGSKVRATSINTHEPFDIVVENVPKNTGAVSISFSMKNMNMGIQPLQPGATIVAKLAGCANPLAVLRRRPP